MGVFCLILFIIWVVYNLSKESRSDARMREWARQQGYKTYWSSTGERYVSTNSKLNGDLTGYINNDQRK